ncbi:MAG TPA: DNA polymerase III subunit gamma/tau [Planctomycetaceae bacterium]|nr:DNA polymerase III subunit gamma/tau [Planctomycetaceae bacterium]
MEYTVLARRFRPQSFGEVVGQEMISQALRNAIASERVAHAYLFTGARGVGKTSTARILAKSLNCPNAKGGDPCNECEICRSISVGSDVDVIEIDGASNRGIDEIRDLRANVNIKPMRCRYKIYIIDEVHMLTTPAFNALLKTLEEPPPNVKFIFCTTEPEKVPDTILSRCQRFDFGTIATTAIKQRLSEIATAEGVSVEPAALELVARRAAGSMRDSQSLFDQLLAFGGKTIGAADVHRLLGTAPDDRLTGLTAALVAREPGESLRLFKDALEAGAQLGELTDQLLAALRDLMVLAAGAKESGLVSVSEAQRSTLLEQAACWGMPSILAAMEILSATKGRMKGVTYGRILAELALVRMASLEDLDGLGELVELLKSGKFPPSGTGATGSPKGQPTTAPQPSGDARSSASSRSGGPVLAAGHQPVSDLRGAALRIDAQHPHDASKMTENDDIKQVVDSGCPADERSDETVPLMDRILFESGNENAIWTQVISLLSDMTKSHAKNVLHAAISGPNKLVLTFPKSYHLSKQNFERSPEQLRRVEAAVEQVVGRPVRIVLAVSDVETVATENRPNRGEVDRRQQESENDPLVQRVLSAFGGSVVRVETASGAGSESIEPANRQE